MNIGRFTLAAVALVSLLAGCTSLPSDRGSGDVQQLIATRSAEASAVRWDQDNDATTPALQQLLSAPVDADAAVRIALASSPRMRVLYAGLGFAQADVYDATRLSNPSIGYERLSASAGGVQRTWSLSQSFTELLFAGFRARMGRLDLLQAKQQVAHELLLLESEVRTAWYQYAATRLSARLHSSSARAAQISAELAQRFYDAGNISALQLAREQASASTALIAARNQASEAEVARSELLALMGIRDQTELVMDDGLPLPTTMTTDLQSLQATALEQRLDLAALATGLALSLEQERHIRRWRWVSGLTLDLTREREADGSTLKGAGISLELPVFNTGGGAKLRAGAAHEAAAALLSGARLDVGAEVAARYSRLRTAERNALEYRAQLLPLRQKIVEYTAQQQNFMLVGTFELIESRRQDIEAWQGYIESLRAYAVARAELARAIGGRLPGDAADGDTVTIPELPQALDSGEQP